MPSIHRGSVVINHFAIYVGDWKSRRNGDQDAVAAKHLSNRVDPRFQRSRFRRSRAESSVEKSRGNHKTWGLVLHHPTLMERLLNTLTLFLHSATLESASPHYT